ncbi:MAG TPA: alpha/beta fold hydrolase [Anaerolineales bacterium]|nr:alpha/beta fold hydrolase [Anaerolineales bacterium]
MDTSFLISLDGTRIAYDVSGEGSAIVMLHGGWHTRQNWHSVGYVKRLKDDFKVITIDLRGNGESDKPIDPTYYTTEKMCQDILAVADACNVQQFMVWGFSYGGNIGRYLAAQSERVGKLIIMGIPFGLGAPAHFRQFIEEFRTHWLPILRAQSDGTLDIASLPTEDQEELQKTNIAVDVARLSAILDWRAIEPADIGCRTLWLIGSKNESAMASLREYEEELKMSKVRVEVLDG